LLPFEAHEQSIKGSVSHNVQCEQPRSTMRHSSQIAAWETARSSESASRQRLDGGAGQSRSLNS
jgi:hypothetical protein